MFRIWIPAAHGILGPLDELMVIAAFVIFVAMLVAPPVITYIQRQRNGGELPQESPQVPADEQANNSDDHYRLD